MSRQHSSARQQEIDRQVAARREAAYAAMLEQRAAREKEQQDPLRSEP